ncbi:MAG: ElyC/SanA/YdcF family protein [Lacunisphaera sp.]
MPESLEADLAGRPTGQPSFAFRQVLAYVLQTAEANDQVYLAPANAFGGALTEEQVAYHYLRAKHARFQLRCPGINLPAIVDRPAYVDTWDNAVLLSRVIAKEGMNFELVTTALHARRAAWCFSRVGFDLSRVHAVPYVQKSEPCHTPEFLLSSS